MKWLTWSETKWFQRNLIYLKMAELWSLNSHAQRAKVGALLVKDGCIISDGQLACQIVVSTQHRQVSKLTKKFCMQNQMH